MKTAAVCLLLAAAVWFVFGQTTRHGFIDYDDPAYVYENAHIKAGLSLQGIAWAFTHVHSFNWHPLTTISHMADCQFYGVQAGGHHLTSVLLHAAAAILLFLVLREMTGAFWCSAFVAAMFAIHPLRVESVAWVAERKDVLSGVFFMLTLWAYVRYARNRPSLLRYLLVAFLFALGLLSKPSLVTLPFVLLLLDYWPLHRFGSLQPVPSSAGSSRKRTLLHLVLEKLPLIALSAASCVATLTAQQGAVVSVQESALSIRIENAALSYVNYLIQTVYPARLLVYYSLPSALSAWHAALAAVFLLAVTTMVFLLRRAQPWLLTGWLWYIGMLVPMIGLVKVGDQARADRYTYLSQIGISLAVTWWIASLPLLRARSWLRPIPGIAAIAVILLFMAGAHSQAAYWKSSEVLWNHMLEIDPGNLVANKNLGLICLQTGRTGEAERHFRTILELHPGSIWAHNNLGILLAEQGRLEEAMQHFQTAYAIDPQSVDTNTNLGLAFSRMGQPDQAVIYFRKVLEIDPGIFEAQVNLGVICAQRNETGEAIAHFRKALEIQPDAVDLRDNLGVLFAQNGQSGESIEQFEKALAIQPDDLHACKTLAWILATGPKATPASGAQAVALATRLLGMTDTKDPGVFDALAAVYAESGKFPEALQAARQAMELALSQGNKDLSDEIGARLNLYEQGKPFRDAVLAAKPQAPGR